MAKFTWRKLQPDDPIFTRGPQISVPAPRPTPEEVAAYQTQRQAQCKGQTPEPPADPMQLVEDEFTKKQGQMPADPAAGVIEDYDKKQPRH